MSPASVSSHRAFNSRIKIQTKSRKNTLPRKLKPIHEKANIVDCFPILKSKSVSVKNLTNLDINWYRLDYYENVCINLLYAGYHQTFVELFKIVQLQDEHRRRAGPASVIWNVKLLKDRHDQLQVLLRYLIDAEIALAACDLDQIYRVNLAAAHFFRASEDDRWLVKYFLCKCTELAYNTVHHLEAVRAIHQKTGAERSAMLKWNEKNNADPNTILDEPLKIAKRRVLESTFHMITFLYETEHFLEALIGSRNLFNKLTEEPSYKTPPIDPNKEQDTDWVANARPLIAEVCEKVCECTLQLFSMEWNEDSDTDSTFVLLDALNFATESGNQHLIGMCKLRISEEYERQQAAEQALNYATEYYDLAQKLDDIKHRIEACKAMARIHQKLSNNELAQHYLTELGNLTDKCDDTDMSIDVTALLAHFHVTQSYDYQKACNFAENGFHLASTNLINSSDNKKNKNNYQFKQNMLRVWYGVAKGSALQSAFMPTVVEAQEDADAMFALLNWRSFGVPLPAVDANEYLEKTKYTFHQRAVNLRSKTAPKPTPSEVPEVHSISEPTGTEQ